MEFENGAVYQGYCSGRMREGIGIQKWLDGSTYEGQWAQNKANGKGKFMNAKRNEWYDGEWVDDRATG